jgi:predicted TIM-barrel fold metal-dependent hydrolase
MLIDFHATVLEEPGYGEALAETARNLGFDRLCIGGGEPRYGLASNSVVRRLADSYPGLFVPFARLQLGQDGPAAVERFAQVGFAGLRIWAPPAPWDDDAFRPVFAAAETLKMPVLCHTGLLPRTAIDIATGVRPDNARPVHLDLVARRFPELKLIGVGLGRPWYDEAVETMRLNPNIYFDLSGGVCRVKSAQFLSELLHPGAAAARSPWQESDPGGDADRLLFGTAMPPTEIEAAERNCRRLFRTMGLETATVDGIMGSTAAAILGLTEAEN